MKYIEKIEMNFPPQINLTKKPNKYHSSPSPRRFLVHHY